MARCSALPSQPVAEPAAPPDYGALVSHAVNAFKPFATYTNFEISSPRWVHAETGWNWLVCLRYEDHGRRRVYSFFIEDNTVVSERYDILTDRCGAEQYVPFNIDTGVIGSPTPALQQPIY